jgi:hypothetical protein
MMPMIECIASGLVYSNPQPHLRAIHAWHPSLVQIEGQELLCAFDLGQAVEGFDYRTYLSRSTDGGRTWGRPVRLFHDPVDRPTTHTVRISRARDGTLMAVGARFYRDDPEQGLTNRETMGYVPLDLIQLRSHDAGQTWQGPEVIAPPLTGPTFEVCHSILELGDGRLLFPTQTWPDWAGQAPHGMKAVALVSHNRGAQWTEYLDVFDGASRGVIHFEQSIVQLDDGRLLAMAWAYDAATRNTLPTPYAICSDGRHFSSPQLTGLRGQTAKLLSLDNRYVVCAYRRDDRPGLWGQLARIDGDRWINRAELLLWQGADAARPSQNTSDQLSGLKFGYPSLVRTAPGEVMVVFWCEEGGLHNIRWFKLRIELSRA